MVVKHKNKFARALGTCYSSGMAAKKKRKPTPAADLIMVSTRVPSDTHQRLKVAAAFHRLSVQELVNKGILMALGDL